MLHHELPHNLSYALQSWSLASFVSPPPHNTKLVTWAEMFLLSVLPALPITLRCCKMIGGTIYYLLTAVKGSTANLSGIF